MLCYQVSDTESDFAGFTEREENIKPIIKIPTTTSESLSAIQKYSQLKKYTNIRNSGSVGCIKSRSSKTTQQAYDYCKKLTQKRNKRNSSSSSDLPVSSHSCSFECDSEGNCLDPRKYCVSRSKLDALKSRNPQLSQKQKVLSWQCATDMSDVEDVNNFDMKLKQLEFEREVKKICCEESSVKEFSSFHSNMIESMKKQLCESLCSSTVERDKPTTSTAIDTTMRRKRLKGGAIAQMSTHQRKELFDTYRINTPTSSLTSNNSHGDEYSGDTCATYIDKINHSNKSYKNKNQSIISTNSYCSNCKTCDDDDDNTNIPSTQDTDYDNAITNKILPGGLIQLRADFHNDIQKKFLQENKHRIFNLMNKSNNNVTDDIVELNYECLPTITDDSSSVSVKCNIKMFAHNKQQVHNNDSGQLSNGSNNEENMKSHSPKVEFCSYLGLQDKPITIKKQTALQITRRSTRIKNGVRNDLRENKLQNLKQKQLVSIKNQNGCIAQIQKYNHNDDKLNKNDADIKVSYKISTKPDQVESKTEKVGVQNDIKKFLIPLRTNYMQHIEKLPNLYDNPSCNRKRKVDQLQNVDNMGMKNIHQRVQKCLESSRQAKPSIFIVQSLSRNDDIKKVQTQALASQSIQQQQQQYSNDIVNIEQKQSKVNNFKEIVDTKKEMQQQSYNKNEALFVSKNRNTNIRKILGRTTFKQRLLRSNHNNLIKSLRSNIKLKVKDKQKAYKYNIRKRLRPAKAKKYIKTNNKNKSVSNISTLNKINVKKVLKTADGNDNVDGNKKLATKNKINTNDGKRSLRSPTMKSRHTTMRKNHNINNNHHHLQKKHHNVIKYLLPPSVHLRNPLQSNNGEILYIYYEGDILICVQEIVISFWKSTKITSILSATIRSALKYDTKDTDNDIIYNLRNGKSPTPTIMESLKEWTQLGQTKRFINDIEIDVPYANRICLNNAMPVYIELRCRYLPQNTRDCHLLSMFIHVYFFNEEEMRARMYAIQLDTVQSSPNNIIFTTIIESRYFIMCWPQENIAGKTLTGLCKYSLTPQMDTLASIRPFKSMRHKICSIDCLEDDKLIGFGETQVTIWDHRSGDILMNYDIEIQLGRNIGSIFYPSIEFGQNNIVLLFQHINLENSKYESDSEIMMLACNISHLVPSHRILKRQKLPKLFDKIKNSVKTAEHCIATAKNNEEIWISRTNPDMVTTINSNDMRRFYMRDANQLIVLTDETLFVDTFSNHILKLAAGNSNY